MRAIILGLALASPVLAQSILRYPIGHSPATLDPARSNNLEDFKTFAQLYLPPLLTRAGPDGVVSVEAGGCNPPTVAEDGLELRFTLVPKVRFHDDACFPGGKGRELAPADWRYVLLRHADPAVQSPFYASFLEGRIAGLDEWRAQAAKDGVADYDAAVSGIALESGAFRLKLTRPYPQLVPLLTQPWASAVPVEAVRTYGTGLGEHPVGAGPFRLESKDALGNLRLVRHRGYHLTGVPKVDELRLDVVSAAEARSARFLSQDLDLLELGPDLHDVFLDRWGALRAEHKKKGLHIATGPSLDTSYLVFGLHHKVLAKKGVRQAIAHALDRKAFAEKAYGTRGELAHGPVPTGLAEQRIVALLPDRYATRDVAKSRALLMAAGHENGAGISELTLDVPGGVPTPALKDAVEGLVRNLAEVGIRVRIRECSFGEWRGRSQRQDFDFAWVSWYADYLDPENFLVFLRSHGEDEPGGSNYGGWRHEGFDALYDRIATMGATKDRANRVAEAAKIVEEEVPILPLGHLRRLHVLQKRVKGFSGHVLNWSLADVEVAKPAK